MAELLEREHELAALVAAVDDAVDGRGSVVLIQGAAGSGKSRLTAAFTRAVEGRAQVLTDPGALHTVLHAELDLPGLATVLVVENLQWADDATVDVLRQLARRIHRAPVVLVLTYRNDSAPHRDRLSAVLGEVAGVLDVRRLELRPLSREAVHRMAAGSGLDPDELHELTSGNPFFVTEVLAAGGTDPTPPAVVDAVLSRLHRLPQRVRRTVEQLAVVPAAAPRWLVEELVSRPVTDLDVAEAHGLLVVEPLAVSFRQEIVRRAVAGSLSGALRVELNRRVLTALGGRADSDPSLLVHHAAEAGDAATLVRLGPQVARDAARSGAHRRAVAVYRRVVDHLRDLSPLDQANVLEEYAIECYVTGSDAEAADAQLSAVGLYETLDDRHALGSALRWLSRMWWRCGRAADAEQAARRARRLVEGWRDPRGLPHSLTALGSAYWIGGIRAAGQSLVEDSVRAAVTAGDVDEACRAYANLAWMLIDDLWLEAAGACLAEAVQLAEQAEHLGSLEQLRIIRSFLGFLTGDWDAAMRDADLVADSPRPLTRCTSLVVAGRIRIRRGLPGGDELLTSAIRLARDLGAEQLGVASAGRAESAWLAGDLVRARELAEPAYRRAVETGHSRLERAELGHWLTRAGGTVPADDPGHPYTLGNSGLHREAAARWAELGCPYEQAAALAETGHPDEGFAAARQLEALDAGPLARLVRTRLPARRPVTQQELARLVGVSQATVSLALNGRDAGRVSPETRERVLQAALSTGYLR